MFRLRFPEFKACNDAFLQGFLDAAEPFVNAAVFQTRRAEAIGYLAAHRLALSPYGPNAKLVSKMGTTTYGTTYDVILATCTSGYRVA